MYAATRVRHRNRNRPTPPPPRPRPVSPEVEEWFANSQAELAEIDPARFEPDPAPPPF
jgi:hypothetical protein